MIFRIIKTGFSFLPMLPQAGGLKDFSRWLSEAWRATPPEKYHEKNRIPEGCQIRVRPVSGTPPGCGVFYHVSRWCRALTRPQPPAKILQASGLPRRPSFFALPALLAALVFSASCTSVSHSPRVAKRESRPEQTRIKGEATSIPANIIAGYFIVEVKWDKHGPWRFLVDTGSSTTLLSPEYVARYPGLTRDGSSSRPVAVRSASGAIDTLTPATVSVIKLGGAQFQNVPVLVYNCADLSAHFGMKIDGVIGFPLFRDTVFTMDYPQARLTVYRPDAPHPTAGATIPFNNEKHAPIIPVRLGGETLSVLIDSGCDGALELNPVGLAPAPVFVQPPRTGTTIGTFAGDRMQEIGRLASELRIGAYTIASPIVDITDQLSSIGGEILENYRITFDQKHGNVTFFRNTDAPLVLEPEHSAGLGFTKTPAYWRVASVVPGSPAEHAGVHAGDIVSRINGEPVSAWPLRRYDELVHHAEEIGFTFVVGDHEKSLVISTFDLVK